MDKIGTLDLSTYHKVHHLPPAENMENLEGADCLFFPFFTSLVKEMRDNSYLDTFLPILLSTKEVKRKLNIYFSTHPLVVNNQGNAFISLQDAYRKLDEIEKKTFDHFRRCSKTISPQ